MALEIPPFDKIAYCYKILESKNEYIVLRELSILSCEKAKERMPKEHPNYQRDLAELDAQIARFKDEIEGANLDKENVVALIEKYEAEKKA